MKNLQMKNLETTTGGVCFFAIPAFLLSLAPLTPPPMTVGAAIDVYNCWNS